MRRQRNSYAGKTKWKPIAGTSIADPSAAPEARACLYSLFRIPISRTLGGNRRMLRVDRCRADACLCRRGKGDRSRLGAAARRRARRAVAPRNGAGRRRSRQFRHREMLDAAQPLRARQAAGAQDRRAFCGPRRAHRARADQPLLPDEGDRPPRLRQRGRIRAARPSAGRRSCPQGAGSTRSCRRSATIPVRAISSSSPIWRRSRR